MHVGIFLSMTIFLLVAIDSVEEIQQQCCIPCLTPTLKELHRYCARAGRSAVLHTLSMMVFDSAHLTPAARLEYTAEAWKSYSLGNSLSRSNSFRLLYRDKRRLP